jgi:hypothetical protein
VGLTARSPDPGLRALGYLLSMFRCLLGALLLLTVACERSPAKDAAGSAACGLASLAGPTALLGQFSVPEQTLGSPPRHLPERLVARLVAGPAYPAIVGRSDSSWVIGVEGRMPSNVKPGYGVLVMDRNGKTRGVMLFEGTPVEGAPQLGTVSVGNATVPLIGIQLDPAKIEDPRCPFFPDSVLQ